MTTRDKQPPRRGALGKGISSLLGNVDETEPTPAAVREPSDGPAAKAPTGAPANRGRLETALTRLDVAQIDPNPYQPRKIFDETALKELSASLKHDGVLQPIIVARGEQAGRYMIIAGERRWRASKLAGLDTIPAIIKDGATDDMLRLALIENIQRAELNIMEEAEAYASLIKDYGLTQEQCAERVGKERSTVANTLRLLALPREIQDDIMETRLTMGHGRALLSLEEKKLMLRARDIVIKKGLSVRQTEQLVKTFRSKKDPEPKGSIKDQADLAYVTESLRSYLHTKVRLAGNTSRGKIEISYFSAAELERILKQMGHQF
jgi:ParB family chromosome partitioning protein